MQAVNQAMTGQALPSGLHGHHCSAEAWRTVPPYDADTLQASPPASRTHHAEHSSIESETLSISYGALLREAHRWKGGHCGGQKGEVSLVLPCWQGMRSVD